MKVSFEPIRALKKAKYPNGFFISSKKLASVREDADKGMSVAHLALKYNVSETTIRRIINRTGRFKHE